MYRFTGLFNFSNGTWDQFFQLYKDKRIVNGDWFDFNLSWWQHKDLNFFFVTYEEMKKDIRMVLQNLSKFLNKPLTDQLIHSIIEHTSFDHMKENKMVNYEAAVKENGDSKFMRKGQVGDWVNYFSKEQSDLCDAQLEEKLSGTSLKFDT